MKKTFTKYPTSQVTSATDVNSDVTGTQTVLKNLNKAIQAIEEYKNDHQYSDATAAAYNAKDFNAREEIILASEELYIDVMKAISKMYHTLDKLN